MEVSSSKASKSFSWIIRLHIVEIGAEIESGKVLEKKIRRVIMGVIIGWGKKKLTFNTHFLYRYNK